MTISQKFSLPMRLVEHLAEDLRPPVVEAAEDREHEAAEQHVVEVRDDEVGVGLLRVGGHDRVHDAREPADRELRDEAEREQHRRREPHRAAPHRAEPVEDLHAGRDRDEHRREAERGDGDRADARREHVVRPHAPAEEADRDAGEHDDRVAEQRLAREHRQDLGDDAHAREDEDVHLGMAEDPEQVLVQQRIAAGRGVEEVRVEVAVHEDHDQRGGDAAASRTA